MKAAGGVPRTGRGMTLDPRIQLIEFNARARTQADLPLEARRRQVEGLSLLFGGGPVSGVRKQRVYVTGRSHSVPADLYVPTVRDNSATMLVYYHFGGGVVGSPLNCARLCALIAKYSGAPVMSVEYRLAPEYKFPAGLEDATAAYLWAVENAARFGASVNKAAVGGDSMGGNFAAVIAQQMQQGRQPKPAFQLLIYPGVDFTSETASMREFASAFPLTSETLEYFVANYLPEDADPADPRLSPGRTQNLAGLPPALVYTAGFDMLLDQGEAYAERLRQAGVKVQSARFDSLPHGFVAFPSAAPAAEAAVKRIARETAAAMKGKFGRA
ncbi:MAG: alpha/beta hydrolase [Hyphomonadaceae bacterium]|nr:alpha/beta hydrolase [Hyphomonadaceae bacterium]